jgi:hypothetical protein
MRYLWLFLLGVVLGVGVPASAQQVVRIYGALSGTTGTPQLIYVSSTGAVSATAVP